jgi:hypothetical protein
MTTRGDRYCGGLWGGPNTSLDIGGWDTEFHAIRMSNRLTRASLRRRGDWGHVLGPGPRFGRQVFGVAAQQSSPGAVPCRLRSWDERSVTLTHLLIAPLAQRRSEDGERQTEVLSNLTALLRDPVDARTAAGDVGI